MELVQPTLAYLPGYVDALNRGWHADNTRGAAAIQEDLDAIQRDPALFVARRTDIEAKGPGITLPDGTVAKPTTSHVAPPSQCGASCVTAATRNVPAMM